MYFASFSERHVSDILPPPLSSILQLSYAALEIARYRDLRFRSGKAVLGSWRVVESHRCISSHLSIARLNHAPFPDALSHETRSTRGERSRETPLYVRHEAVPFVHRRPSTSSSSLSSSSSFRGERRFRKSNSTHFHVLMYEYVGMVYEERSTHVHRKNLCFYKRIRVGRGRTPVSITCSRRPLRCLPSRSSSSTSLLFRSSCGLSKER